MKPQKLKWELTPAPVHRARLCIPVRVKVEKGVLVLLCPVDKLNSVPKGLKFKVQAVAWFREEICGVPALLDPDTGYLHLANGQFTALFSPNASR